MAPPAASARSRDSRIWASCSGVEPSRSITPAPPWTTSFQGTWVIRFRSVRRATHGSLALSRRARCGKLTEAARIPLAPAISYNYDIVITGGRNGDFGDRIPQPPGAAAVAGAAGERL